MSSGIIFVLSSPSGAGKTSLSKALCNDDSTLVLSLSATTRQPRPSEKPDIDYIFLTETDFLQWKKEGKFLESAQIFGQYYGTLKQSIQQTLNQGKDMIFTIDWQGTQQLKQLMGDKVVTIFILPPSRTVLEERLINRAQDSLEVINTRLAAAYTEISHWTEYTYTVVNENFSDTLENIKAIIKAEKLKQYRQQNLLPFVESLKF